MTDEAKALVEALKRYALTYNQRWKLVDLVETQAREIERLREALNDVTESYNHWTAVIRARAALAGDSHDQ